MDTDGGRAESHRGIWANLWWGVSRGVALACLPLVFRMVQGGYLASRIPGTPSPDTRLAVDFVTLALGAALGAIAGLLRPLTRSLLGSLLFGVVLVEAGALGLWYFIRQSARPLETSTLIAVALFGLVLGAAAYLGRQPEKRQI